MAIMNVELDHEESGRYYVIVLHACQISTKVEPRNPGGGTGSQVSSRPQTPALKKRQDKGLSQIFHSGFGNYASFQGDVGITLGTCGGLRSVCIHVHVCPRDNADRSSDSSYNSTDLSLVTV